MSPDTELSDQSRYLSILTQVPPQQVKDFVEELLANLPVVQVITSRTGLAMLPYTDSAQGVTFYLGETLLAEAEVRVGAQAGYAACLGRDLEQVIALAVLDATLQSSEAGATAQRSAILQWIATVAQQQQEQEALLLRKVAATRVDLETF